jgi:hypothetical protein
LEQRSLSRQNGRSIRTALPIRAPAPAEGSTRPPCRAECQADGRTETPDGGLRLGA